MADLSDETLMAYADGELTHAERAGVDARLAVDPASRARLEMFEATGKSLADHFRKPIEQPVPGHLIALVLGGSTQAASTRAGRAAGAQTPSFSELVRRAIAASLPRWPVALAYSTVLLIGTGAGWYLRDGTMRTATPLPALIALDSNRIIASGALHQALETAPSGAQVEANNGRDRFATVQSRLTFKNRDMAYCRQYELAMPNGGQFSGIGCRGADGRWHVLAHTEVVSRRASQGRTVAAGSGGSAALEGLVDRMIEGDALGAADEAALIRKQWQP